MTDTEIINFIREFLGKLEISYTGVERVDMRVHPLYIIHTDESAKLIGNHGDTLHALNLIVQKCLESRMPGEAQFSVDVNGYKLKHIHTVEESGRLAAERVRTFKHDVEMEPMSSYDRLIVHSLLADDPDVVTESAGEGETRRVVIRPRASA